MTTACAPGKIILLGEHAVVYGRPALAVPVRQVRVCATIEPTADGDSHVYLEVPDLEIAEWIDERSPSHPIAAIWRAALARLGREATPTVRIRIDSSIPIASGLGSSAAVSIAVARALADHLGEELSIEAASDLAFEVEKLHHGTPSGIDNTVIAYDRPVYFVRGRRPEPLAIGGRFHFLIGHTGIPAPTAEAVAEVRALWQAAPKETEAVFDAIGDLVEAARAAITAGDAPRLGGLLDENHVQLIRLRVSSPDLDRLADAARSAGALGAKMSGGGKGGNMIAVVFPQHVEQVAAALEGAGAASVLHTEVSP